MNLGIDLDGTTYDFFTLFRNWWAETQDIDPVSLGDAPQSWGFFEAWGCDIKVFKQMLRDGVTNRKLYWEGDAYPDAPEVIQRLSKDHKITIVTSRNLLGLEKEMEEATSKWLKGKEIPYDEIILTDTKTGLGLDIMLDDAPHIIQAAKDAGERAVFYDAPHNSLIDHPRVFNWKEFEALVNE